jgi:phage tail sheath gpL-like
MINSCCYSHNSNLKSATKSKEKKNLYKMQCNAMQTCISTAILVAAGAAAAAAADQSVNIESRSVPS